MKKGWSLLAIIAGLFLLISGPIRDRNKPIPPGVPAQAALTVTQGKAIQAMEVTRKMRRGNVTVSQVLELTLETPSGAVIVRLPKEWAGDAFHGLQGATVDASYDRGDENLLYELRSGSRQLLSYDQVAPKRRVTLDSAKDDKKLAKWMGFGLIAIGALGFLLGRRRG